MVNVSDETRRRWYCLTPDRLVVALLALEGFLLLSEWFGWFAKGWAVVTAVATVAAAFVLLLLWFAAALLFRLRFQFSLRSLMLLALIVAIPCSWLKTAMKQARKQRETVETITKLHGEVSYDFEIDRSGEKIPDANRPGPAWLRTLLGDDLFVDVALVDFYTPEFSDAGLEQIEERLKALTRLQHLRLWSCNVSDSGLKRIEGLTQLQSLHSRQPQRQRRRPAAPRRIAPAPNTGFPSHHDQRIWVGPPRRIAPTPNAGPLSNPGHRLRAAAH